LRTCFYQVFIQYNILFKKYKELNHFF